MTDSLTEGLRDWMHHCLNEEVPSSKELTDAGRIAKLMRAM